MWYFKPNQIRDIHFEISNYCNAACPECPRSDPMEIDDSTGENRYLPLGWIDTHFLPLDLIKRNFNQNKTPSLQNISFCGCFGDALTHPNFIPMIDYFIEEFPQLSIYVHTNGGLKTADYWTRLAHSLKKAYYHEVIWGIDGLEATNEIYRVGVRWQRLEENFRAFNQAGGNSHWQYIIFPHNFQDVEEAKARSKAEGFAYFRKVLSFRNADYKAEDLPDEYRHFISKDNSESTEVPEYPTTKPLGSLPAYTYPESIPFDNYDLTTGKFVKCSSQDRHNVFVFSEGTIWPCNKLGFNLPSKNRSDQDYCYSQHWETDHDARNTNSLHKYDIEEIMENGWWSEVYESHKKGDFCYACSEDCGQLVENKEFYATKDLIYVEKN
jgi:hypothetical protein